MSRNAPHRRDDHPTDTRTVTRRGVLRTAGGLAAATALGAAPAGRTARRAHAAPATFTHPGMLHNAGDINRAKVRVAAGDEPWLSGWNRLTANSHAQSTWTPNPQASSLAPEGGGGDYGSVSGGYDQLGFGTLMYAK